MANQFFPTNPSSKIVSLWDDDTTLMDEGHYFVATNTPGTPLAGTICVDDAATASSTHAQFAPTVLIYNNSVSGATAPNIYLRYIRVRITTAPASATSWFYSLRMDPVQRYSSGGTKLTPINVNPGLSPLPSSNALLYFGAIVPTALPSANSLLVGYGQWDSAIPVVGDQYTLQFGSPPTSNDMLSGGATAKNVTMVAPPMGIPPGWSLALDMWGPSNAVTPASYDVEMAWVERIPGL